MRNIFGTTPFVRKYFQLLYGMVGPVKGERVKETQREHKKIIWEMIQEMVAIIFTKS